GGLRPHSSEKPRRYVDNGGRSPPYENAARPRVAPQLDARAARFVYSPSATPKITCAASVTTTNSAVRFRRKKSMYGVNRRASSSPAASAMAHSQLRLVASPIIVIYMTPKVTPLEK